MSSPRAAELAANLRVIAEQIEAGRLGEARVEAFFYQVSTPVLPYAPDGPQDQTCVGSSVVIHTGAANDQSLLARLWKKYGDAIEVSFGGRA